MMEIDTSSELPDEINIKFSQEFLKTPMLKDCIYCSPWGMAGDYLAKCPKCNGLGWLEPKFQHNVGENSKTGWE